MGKGKFLFYFITGTLTGLVIAGFTGSFFASLSTKLFGGPTILRVTVGVFLILLFSYISVKRQYKKYVTEN
ncbi:hypothetical protein [Bacillus suaedae]|uniref:Uncharacterized protein n=1 Tax=Halalkalibacter suaedae TaxID=2822140 RepID=A0A941AQ84_9BACI|nr:hypothetical protein [Bacillus suaedae]MBP3952526.1 hypothetical protein [Bacillus suaedae]